MPAGTYTGGGRQQAVRGRQQAREHRGSTPPAVERHAERASDGQRHKREATDNKKVRKRHVERDREEQVGRRREADR